MINRWTNQFEFNYSTPDLFGHVCVCVFACVCVCLPHLYSHMHRHSLAVPFHLSVLKVRRYSRSKVAISMAEIVSLSFPCRPETENNFPVFPGICRYQRK